MRSLTGLASTIGVNAVSHASLQRARVPSVFPPGSDSDTFRSAIPEVIRLRDVLIGGQLLARTTGSRLTTETIIASSAATGEVPLFSR